MSDENPWDDIETQTQYTPNEWADSFFCTQFFVHTTLESDKRIWSRSSKELMQDKNGVITGDGKRNMEVSIALSQVVHALGTRLESPQLKAAAERFLGPTEKEDE